MDYVAARSFLELKLLPCQCRYTCFILYFSEAACFIKLTNNWCFLMSKYNFPLFFRGFPCIVIYGNMLDHVKLVAKKYGDSTYQQLSDRK